MIQLLLLLHVKDVYKRQTLIRPVKTAQVSSQSVIRKDFSGIVEAVDYVRLAFRVSGQIISLPVDVYKRQAGKRRPP